MSMTEQKVQIMQDGRKSSFLLQELTPIFDEVRRNILEEQQAVYRSGNTSEAKLVASVAKLSILIDIEDLLKAKISMSQEIEKEVNRV